MLDGGDELARLQQRFVRAGIEPGHATAHDLDMELATLEISPVHVGDFKLTPRRRGNTCSNVEHLLIVKIQARHSGIGGRPGGFLLDADGAALGIELHHAITFGIVHMVGKDGSPRTARVTQAQLRLQIMAVINVVAQNQGRIGVADKISPDDEGLGQAIGAGLLGIT